MTSAPKSDITVAAAGPAIKLAQSSTFRPSKTRSPIGVLRSNGQTKRVAVADDAARRSPGEVRADHQGRGFRQAGQHPLTSVPRLERIGIRGRRPLRPRNLAGMMHEIAGYQRRLSLRDDPYADVAWGVSQGRDKADLVTEPVIRLDEIDQPGIPDRRHRIGEHRSHVLSLV